MGRSIFRVQYRSLFRSNYICVVVAAGRGVEAGKAIHGLGLDDNLRLVLKSCPAQVAVLPDLVVEALSMVSVRTVDNEPSEGLAQER